MQEGVNFQNSVCQCGRKQMWPGLSHVKLLISSSRGSKTWPFIPFSLFTQHRGRQMHRMWLPTEIQPLYVLHSGNGSLTPISILICNANLSAIMYIKESIEYLEHRHIPIQLRSPMLLYDFLWFSTPWTKTKKLPLKSSIDKTVTPSTLGLPLPS